MGNRRKGSKGSRGKSKAGRRPYHFLICPCVYIYPYIRSHVGSSALMFSVSRIYTPSSALVVPLVKWKKKAQGAILHRALLWYLYFVGIYKYTHIDLCFCRRLLKNCWRGSKGSCGKPPQGVEGESWKIRSRQKALPFFDMYMCIYICIHIFVAMLAQVH